MPAGLFRFFPELIVPPAFLASGFSQQALSLSKISHTFRWMPGYCGGL